MDMKKWLDEVKASPVKKAIPILSFPSIQLMGIGVKDLIMNSDMQAKGMKAIADRVDSWASVSMMDLSVEAEAFGAEIMLSDHEVPTVIGHVVDSMEKAEQLKVPEIGAGRTGLYIEAIEKACRLIQDRPVFAGVIGPFSLAGRLMNVSDTMIYCFDEPDMVQVVLEKATEFIIKYIKAYKAVGAGGVVIAEPLAGLLSPRFNAKFSVPYLQKIVEEVQDESFIVIYHNCGDGALRAAGEIFKIGADAYHFGNSTNMAELMTKAPENVVCMGNVDPAGEFCNGTVESIHEATLKVMNDCCKYPNYVISSGCDIPPKAKWENIDEFFKTVAEFYSK